jgi:hypothetical protein
MESGYFPETQHAEENRRTQNAGTKDCPDKRRNSHGVNQGNAKVLAGIKIGWGMALRLID